MNAKLRMALPRACMLGFTLAMTAAVAQTPAAGGYAALAPGDLKWMPAPPVIPPGVQLAVLRGNPFAEGIFTIRLKIPPHYVFPAHWHPTEESLSVLAGTFYLGMGDKLDKSKAKALPVMDYAAMPALHHHYAYTEGEGAVIDLTGYGPFQIYYVNPADDPSKAPAMKH